MKSILTLLLIVTLTGCGHKHEHRHDQAIATTVALNNGERWEANPETTEGIHKMIALVKDFQQQSSSDYAALQQSLTTEFQTIFKKCTMKGEAHDQLHNYLMPLKTELDKLSAENIEAVSSYLKLYEQYFQ